MSLAEQKFRRTGRLDEERLLRDLIQLAQQIDAELADIRAKLDAIEQRLTNGGL